ncbi:MAG: hypothetical protein AAGA75_25050 [Cyanobacteria bacterium P01_E01_bin.6]
MLEFQAEIHFFLKLMHLPPQSPAVIPTPGLEPWPERIEILEAFADVPDVRSASGKRHHMALCLSLVTNPKPYSITMSRF